MINTIQKNDQIVSNGSKKISIINILKRLLYAIIALKKKFDDWLDKKERRIILKKLMEEAETYDDWKRYAKELDVLEGKEKWKLEKKTKLYDYKEVEKLTRILQKKREMRDIAGLVHYIRVNLMKNLYSTSNPALYELCNYGTKYLIDEFQDEMLKSLEYIANFNEKTYPLYKKLEFFSETRHSYGRTALLLSGGASMGTFHIGVIKALYKCHVLPRIVCGSSAGSISAALLCTTPYDQVNQLIERKLQMRPFAFKDRKYSLLRKIVRYITRGVLLDVEVLKDMLRDIIGDSTFQEAFDKTGWILNITVTGYKEHDNHRLLNYLTAPNVIIWSACCASCCIPGVYDPVQLLCKNEYGHIVPYNSTKKMFIDGSISADLPMQRLSELFNVNIFLVSQTNPWVVPFLDQDDNKELFGAEKRRFNPWKIVKNLVYSEVRHRIQQIVSLGILPAYITRSLNLVIQDYRGHVTIFPVPKFIDYLKLLSNPSKEDIDYCTKHSSRRTFPKIPHIEGIVKFEFALEKHHKKLKTKLNKFNFSTDKKYEMEDEEAYDEYQTNLIINNAQLYNTEERKQLNINLQDIINIKTEYFTNSSNPEGGVLNGIISGNTDRNNAPLKIAKNKHESSEDEDIIDKYNKIIFFNEEHKIFFKYENNLNMKSLPNAGDINNPENMDDNKEGTNLSENFSNISPLISHNTKKRNKIKKMQNQLMGATNYVSRHDSFTLPRTQSKLKMYKNN